METCFRFSTCVQTYLPACVIFRGLWVRACLHVTFVPGGFWVEAKPQEKKVLPAQIRRNMAPFFGWGSQSHSWAFGPTRQLRLVGFFLGEKKSPWLKNRIVFPY